MKISRIRSSVAKVSLPQWLALAVSILGLWLRVEHAWTFDGPGRGSDYRAHLSGVHWMLEHWEPFYLRGSVDYQVRFYPPLWYAVSGLILKLSGSERAISTLAVLGWILRHTVLAKLLREAAPGRHWSALVALSINALLPLSVLIDGKVNPEGLHAGVFMVAVYFLWRMERQAREPGGVAVITATLFGLFAGIAMLLKATAALLVITAVLVFGRRSLLMLFDRGLRATWLRLWRPALMAATVWCAVAGFWCGTNLVKFGHPSPHVWNLGGSAQHGKLSKPILYRRPLGWALPFEWHQYWEFPILRSASEPRPNFWAAEIAGTWSDYYNRGFCRLQGGDVTDRVWGGTGGALPQGPSYWSVGYRCVGVFAKLVHVGVWLTVAAVLATLWVAWLDFRGSARVGYGSLVLPLITWLCTLSAFTFALAYPFDSSAVLNPRYLLPQVTPMSACLGLAVAGFEDRARHKDIRGALSILAICTLLVLIGIVGALLVFERFGS